MNVIKTMYEMRNTDSLYFQFLLFVWRHINQHVYLYLK